MIDGLVIGRHKAIVELGRNIHTMKAARCTGPQQNAWIRTSRILVEFEKED